MTALPFKPGDWATDATDRIARVKNVYAFEGEILLDLIIHDRNGDRIGRESPSCGGPRTFEPCCPAASWERIARPNFPVSLKWVSDSDGQRVARYWAGDRLPPAAWTKPERKGTASFRDDRLRQALEDIAKGHNDARGRALEALGRGR